jgi:hypothetical protein
MVRETSDGMDWTGYTLAERVALDVVLNKVCDEFEVLTPTKLLECLSYFLRNNRVSERARAAFASGLKKLRFEDKDHLRAWLACHPKAGRGVSQGEAQAMAKLAKIRRKLEAAEREAGEIRQELEEAEVRLQRLREKERRQLEGD